MLRFTQMEYGAFIYIVLKTNNTNYNTTNVPKSCEFKVMGGFLGTFSDQFILTAHQFPYAHKLCGHEQKVSQYSHLRKKTEQELSPVALS